MSGPRLTERADSVARTKDGGFVAAGFKYTRDEAFAADMFLVKIDAQGRYLWARSFGGPFFDQALCVKEVHKDGLIVAGLTNGESACGLDCAPLQEHFADVYLVRTDDQGLTLWTRALGGEFTDVGYSVAECPDGGFVVAGRTDRLVEGGIRAENVYLAKTDEAGNVAWERVFVGQGDGAVYDVLVLEDGDYVVAGRIRPRAGGEPLEEGYFLRVDPRGRLVWEQRTGSLEGGYMKALAGVNGHLIGVGAIRRNGQGMVHVVALEESGLLRWERGLMSQDQTRPNAAGIALRQVEEGVTVLWRASFVTDRSFLSGLTGKGEVLWDSVLPEGRVGLDLVPTVDGGYVVVGQTVDERGLDMFVMKVRHEMLRRGDADGDGRLNVTDAVGILRWLVLGNKLNCEDAGDTNDNGDLGLDDVVFLLRYLFQRGPSLPPPAYPECGVDPTSDLLECAAYPGCP